MKVDDSAKASGAVLGKALAPLASGTGACCRSSLPSTKHSAAQPKTQ